MANAGADALVLFTQAQAKDRFEYQQNDRGACGSEHQRRANGSRLNGELSGIAEEKTVVAGGIDGLRSEDTGQQCADDSADAVNADDVE